MFTNVNYRFSQRFRVSAERAYQWCTDYDPNDLALMQEKGRRKIKWISKNALILVDTAYVGDGRTKKAVSKTKLVRLNPMEKSWTNTHIAGPVKYSQFLYKIVREGKDRSRLDFRGLQLEPREMTREEVAALVRKVREEDSLAWKHLARAMEEELVK